MNGIGANILELQKLNTGTYSFEFQLDNAFFTAQEGSEILGGDVLVKAALVLREKDYDLSLDIKGTVQLTCDRCLEPMDWPLDIQAGSEMEETVDVLDLNWEAYEWIVVNLPLVHSHQEGGCNPQMAALLQNHLCNTAEDPEIL